MAEPTAGNRREYHWTDDEAELLLHCTHTYKVKKEMECEDWEQIKSKVRYYCEIIDVGSGA